MRTHKQYLDHLRAELERQGAQIVSVRLDKRRRMYRAFSCNFVLGDRGHIFTWPPAERVAVVSHVDATGRETVVGRLDIGE
jgi:hypothetical protein